MKVSKRGVGVLVGVSAALLLLGVPVGLPMAEKEIARRISGPCGPECQLHVRELKLRWNGVWLKDVAFVAGHAGLGEWSVEVPEMVVHPRWTSLRRGDAVFEGARLEAPRITLVEGDQKAKAPKENPPPFYVGRLTINNAHFTYVRLFHGRRGEVRVSHIQVKASAFGTLGDAARETTEVHTEAQLEKSAKVNVEFTAKLFQADPDLQLRLGVSGLELGEVNAYFVPVDGLELTGHLYDASARLESGGKNLSSVVHARYDRLDVKILKVPERSGLAVFFMNLFRGLKIIGSNLHDAPAHTEGRANDTRKPQETMVSFVLRGLKDALVQVAAP